ncbi:MAG: hypothetical protein DRR19_30710, partial [Candidatus Parabeggiatoa sp. nov. 1]
RGDSYRFFTKVLILGNYSALSGRFIKAQGCALGKLFSLVKTFKVCQTLKVLIILNKKACGS